MNSGSLTRIRERFAFGHVAYRTSRTHFFTLPTGRRTTLTFRESFELETRSSSVPATFIEGQGQDQGAVKLDAKGVLSFADLDKNEGSEQGFYRASHRIGNVICESFESRDHPGYYLAGETVNSTAFGKKTTTPRDGAYWKKVHYSTVSGDITHFKQMSSDSPWYCLQYRGDVNSGDNPLYLVAHGKGAAATFSLQHDTDLIRDKSGIFSFL